MSAFRQHGIYWLLFAEAAAACIAVPAFRTYENISNVLIQCSALGLLAIGQTFVILCGLIDLSVGQLLGLAVVVSCAIMNGQSSLAAEAAAAAVAIGVGVGVINGWLNQWLRIHSLILTFGMMGMLEGIIFVYTDRSVGAAAPQFRFLASGHLGWVPAAAALLLAATALAHLILTRTPFGRHIYAVGGDEEHARRLGVDTARVKRFAFVMSGLSAGLAGILVAGRLGTGFPNAGNGYELDAIVAVVLGGTSLAGGSGGVIGTVAAVLVLGLANNILNLLDISSFVQLFIKGLIVIVAIIASQRSAVEAA